MAAIKNQADQAFRQERLVPFLCERCAVVRKESVFPVRAGIITTGKETCEPLSEMLYAARH